MTPFLARFSRLLCPGIYERGRTKNKFLRRTKVCKHNRMFRHKLAICTRLFKPCGVLNSLAGGANRVQLFASLQQYESPTVAWRLTVERAIALVWEVLVLSSSAPQYHSTFDRARLSKRRMVHTSSSGDHLELQHPNYLEPHSWCWRTTLYGAAVPSQTMS